MCQRKNINDKSMRKDIKWIKGMLVVITIMIAFLIAIYLEVKNI